MALGAQLALWPKRFGGHFVPLAGGCATCLLLPPSVGAAGGANPLRVARFKWRLVT